MMYGMDVLYDDEKFVIESFNIDYCKGNFRKFLDRGVPGVCCKIVLFLSGLSFILPRIGYDFKSLGNGVQIRLRDKFNGTYHIEKTYKFSNNADIDVMEVQKIIDCLFGKMEERKQYLHNLKIQRQKEEEKKKLLALEKEQWNEQYSKIIGKVKLVKDHGS
jgi:hypothetical protein